MTRRKGDAYYTPDDVVARCVAALGGLPDVSKVLEPSSGGGAFVRAIRARRMCEITTCDVDPSAARGDVHDVGDFTKVWYRNSFDLIVGNPPYSLALEFVQKSLTLLESGGRVAFLLRLAFLASAKRKAFFEQNPPERVYVLSKRPSFTGDGKTDGADYAFFVWRKGFQGEPTIGWL